MINISLIKLTRKIVGDTLTDRQKESSETVQLTVRPCIMTEIGQLDLVGQHTMSLGHIDRSNSFG